MKRRFAPVVSIAAVALAAQSAWAGVVTTGTAQNNPFVVSASDLLHGLSPTVVGNTNDEEGLGTNTSGVALTNGTFGPGSSHPAPNPEMTLIHNGVTLDYTLPASPLGWDLFQIDTYAGWQDGGRANQNYQVFVSVAGGPLQSIGNIGYAAPNIGSPTDTQVSLADNVTGRLAGNVTAIRFSFPTTQNGYVGYRELDVTGSPSATPARTNLLTNGGFEDPVQTTGGNHIGAVPTGWAVNNGNPGSFNLVLNGPEAFDGSQYLDLTAGGTFIVQTFTLTDASTVEFGAVFSPRDGGTGGGRAAIHNLDQSLVMNGNQVLVGQPYHWELSTGIIPNLPAGTYAFVAFVDEPANVDSAFVHATAIPEPAALGLLGLGVLGLLRRRK